jgi:hypothetical protein
LGYRLRSNLLQGSNCRWRILVRPGRRFPHGSTLASCPRANGPLRWLRDYIYGRYPDWSLTCHMHSSRCAATDDVPFQATENARCIQKPILLSGLDLRLFLKCHARYD